MSAAVKSRKARDTSRRVSESGEELCPVCNDVMNVFAVGKCDHVVCYKCSTRMRALCDQMYCAICRTELPKVIFLRGRISYEEIDTQHFLMQRRYSIYFENNAIQNKFFELLDHVCAVCTEKTKFRSFDVLKTHMRKDHQLFFCDLCVKHLKVFTFERKFYNRQKLAHHKRLGDPDDTSYKGHPLCQFCEERFLDNDELVRHLRKEHYFCHFCDADGISNQFYSDYSFLREHFQEEHYLCEEGECEGVQFTTAFRSEIDLKAHQASEHTRHLRKAQAKQARIIEIDFNYTRRANQYDRGRGRRDRVEHHGGRDHGSRDHGGRDHGGRGVIGGEDYEEVNKGGGVPRDAARPPRGRGGRARDRERRQAEREAEDTARAISASLAEMHKAHGAVNVVDEALIRPNIETRQQTGTKDEKERYQDRSEDFPTLDGKILHQDRDSDEDMKKIPSKESKKTLANKVALAANFTVADGEVDERDFPALGGTKKSAPSGFSGKSRQGSSGTAWKLNMTAEDFPSLGGSKPNAPPPHSNVKPQIYPSRAPPQPQPRPHPKPQLQPEPQVQPRPMVASTVMTSKLEDFPSLSSISSGLLSGPTVSSKKPTSSASAPKASSGANTGIINKPKTEATLKGKNQPSANKPHRTVTEYEPHWDDTQSRNTEVPTNKITVIPQQQQSRPVVTKQVPNVHGKDFPTLGKSSAKHEEPQWQQPKPKHQAKSATTARSSPQPAIVTEDDVDFPSLGNTGKAQSGKVKLTSDDFPSLGGKSTGTKVATNWGPPQRDDKPKEQIEEEFTKVKGNKKKKLKPYKPSQVHMVGTPSQSDNSSDNSDDEMAKPTAKSSNKKSGKKKKAGNNANQIPIAVKVEANVSEILPDKKVKHDKLVIENKEENKNGQKPELVEQVKVKQMNNKDLGSSKKSKKKKAEKNNTSSSENSPRNVDSSSSTEKLLLDDFPNLSALKDQSNVLAQPVVPALSLGVEDFPSLGSGVTVKSSAPPPGFALPASKPPPPGFDSSWADPAVVAANNAVSKIPPPGFGSTAPSNVNQPMSNSDSENIAPCMPVNTDEKHEYIQPGGFQARNQRLIADIQTKVGADDTKFIRFKTCSGEFRQGKIGAYTYYDTCISIMGSDNFLNIFSELLVLLPDIEKQQELLMAHQEARKVAKKGKDKEIIRYNKQGERIWGAPDRAFTSCALCGQVTKTDDAESHLLDHNIKSDFPALGNSGPGSQYGLSAWVRAK